MAAAAKKNRKNLSSELELELQTGKQGEEEEAGKEVVDDDGGDDIGDDVGDGDGNGDENNGYKVAAKEDKEGDQLGLKDLFSKELWLITVVMWIAWPVGKFIHFLFFFAVTKIIVTVTMGYYGITFGMANLSDDIFTNFIVSSIIGELFNVLSHLPFKRETFPEIPAYILVLLVMDIIGRKPLFSGSLLFTGIACIICGLLEEVGDIECF